MDSEIRSLNRNLQRHDRELYAQRRPDGMICVYRRGKRQHYFEWQGDTYGYLIDSPSFVFALTDNWTTSGSPRAWGVLPVLARLRAIDLWNNEEYLDEVDEQNERIERSKQRDLSNNVEAFVRDFRREFARATNDINTSTLDKSEKRRRKRDGIRERK